MSWVLSVYRTASLMHSVHKRREQQGFQAVGRAISCRRIHRFHRFPDPSTDRFQDATWRHSYQYLWLLQSCDHFHQIFTSSLSELQEQVDLRMEHRKCYV